MKKISNKIFIAKLAFILIGVHQMHAMEEGAASDGREEMELSLLVSHAHASHGDSEGEGEHAILQLVQKMCADLEVAAESEDPNKERQNILDELLSKHKELVCEGELDAVLKKLPPQLLCKESDTDVSPSLSLRFWSNSQVNYSKPYQKKVAFETELGKVTGSVLDDDDDDKSVIRIQRFGADEENAGLQTFEINKQCFCLAINELLNRIAYAKKDDGIFYRDLHPDSQECKAQEIEVSDNHQVGVIALSPSGEKLAYCLVRRGNNDRPMDRDSACGGDYHMVAYVYNIPSKTLIQLNGFDFMSGNPCTILCCGFPLAIALAGGGAALGALIGLMVAPEVITCRNECCTKFENDTPNAPLECGGTCYAVTVECLESVCCRERIDLDVTGIGFGVWVGAVVGAVVGCVGSSSCWAKQYRFVAPIAFVDENTVQARYRYTKHTWDVSNVSIDTFKKLCREKIIEEYRQGYVQKLEKFKKIKLKDADLGVKRQVGDFLSKVKNDRVLSEEDKKEFKGDIKKQAGRLHLDNLV